MDEWETDPARDVQGRPGDGSDPFQGGGSGRGGASRVPGAGSWEEGQVYGSVDRRRQSGLSARSARRTVSRQRRRKRLKIVSMALAGVVVVAMGSGYFVYRHLFDKIETVSLSDIPHSVAAPKPNAQGQTPENILVLGSQTRDGQHGVNLGNSSKDGTNLSDTAMLVHLSADRKWAEVVSIPRDLIVPTPSCPSRTESGVTVPASSGAMFDAVMSDSGPICTVETVEQFSGLYINHFVELTFDAFQQLTDAVGGVTICVPPPGINDPNYSGLVLSAGLHTISGAESLEFIRDRHGVGDGTDLGRIQYQQMFVSSLFTKLTSNGTLSDPLTIYKIIDAVASNLTVDTGLDSPSTMVSLAQSVDSIKSSNIQYITAPYEFDPNNINRVVPAAGFNQVWTDLRNDQPLPGSNAAKSLGTTASATPTAKASPSATPIPLSSLDVQVFNSTETSGLAGQATANLNALGVKATVEDSGYSGDDYTDTTIIYPTGQEAEAEALSNVVGGAVLQPSSSVSVMNLVIGDNDPAALTGTPTAKSTAAAASAAATATVSAESRSGNENICSNLPAPVAYGGAPSDG